MRTFSQRNFRLVQRIMDAVAGPKRVLDFQLEPEAEPDPSTGSNDDLSISAGARDVTVRARPVGAQPSPKGKRRVMSNSVGTELLDQIERVACKRQRWITNGETVPALADSLKFGIFAMKSVIEEAKAALTTDDPARCIRALAALQAYDSED